MRASKTIRTELTQVRTDAQKILDEHKDQDWDGETKTTLDTLYTKATGLRTELEESLDIEKKTQDFDNLRTYLEAPHHQVPHGASHVGDGPVETKTVLGQMGWEVKNGLVMAPTSVGKLVEMYPEEVLFGDMPSDATAARYYQQTRAGFQPGYRHAYANYLKNAAKSRSESMAFALLTPDEQKALTEGQDTAGGFLVPPDVQAELLVRVAQMAVIRRYARVQTTSRDILRWPRVMPHPTSGSIYSSGFVGGWVGETPAFTDTDPAFGMFDIPIKKLRTATKLSNDFVSDSAINVLAFLAQNGSENMALVEDSGFINGDGTALQPRGILNAGITTVDVEGSTVNTITNTTSATGSAPKLIDVAYAIPAQYVQGSRWLLRRSIEGKIRKLTDSTGRFLWPAQTQSGFAGVTKTLIDFPVENSDFMPDDGTDANKVMILGDLGGYVIAQRAQVTTVVLRERFADTDQVGIVLFERVGGDVWNTDSFRIGVV